MSSRGAAAKAGDSPGRPILVVDDDLDQRTAVAELLCGRYAVVVACDGQDAVELLEDGLRPCLIVLDLTMPRMDGWAFLAYLRGSARSAVPVLVTSAMATERRPAGADAFLAKPYEAAQLRAAVARLSGPDGAVPARR